MASAPHSLQKTFSFLPLCNFNHSQPQVFKFKGHDEVNYLLTKGHYQPYPLLPYITNVLLFQKTEPHSYWWFIQGLIST